MFRTASGQTGYDAYQYEAAQIANAQRDLNERFTRLVQIMHDEVPEMNESNTPATQSLILDRAHRFEVGDVVRHVDDESKEHTTEVLHLTLRVRDNMAYPTYTLTNSYGEEYEDILCTRDLVNRA